jgi:hypothetical protein
MQHQRVASCFGTGMLLDNDGGTRILIFSTSFTGLAPT